MSVTDEVKARLDIVDVVSETVTLRKSGRSYTGFCPFHSNTKTPSFVVFPDTQTWRCFGACADGGDVFSFVMKREGFTFKEALQLLAERAGVRLEEPSPRTTRQNEQRQKLLEINAAAAAYFQHILSVTPAGAKARAYLSQRQLTAETVSTFQIGYALDEWEALKTQFLERGYTAEDLLAAGLIVERDDGSPGYDRFRHRLIIPIRDAQGQVIGFGARALGADQVPKYLNSPQSLLFDKSDTLYGLDLARQSIRDTGQVVIVEGYMDVIQAYQRGARNVVAQMGTALTELQLKRLAPIANKIVLALDADTAGNTATLRSLSLARQSLPKKHRPTSTSRGIEYEAHLAQEIYIAALPAGQDPDDVLKQGLEVWQRLVDAAVPALDFYEELVVGTANLKTPQGKSFVVRELIPVYREINDNIEKAARVQRLARQINIDERLLLAELKGVQKEAQPSSRRLRRPPPEIPLPPLEAVAEPAAFQVGPDLGLEEYCLALILANPPALAVANDMLQHQEMPGLAGLDFKRGDNREIFNSLQLWTASETPKIERLVEMIDSKTLEQRLATLIMHWHNRPAPPLENINQDLSVAVIRLRLRSVIEQIEELTSLQREAMESKDTEGSRHYTEMVREYSRQRKKLEQTRDALSLTGQRRAEASRFGQGV